jgi:hypothetical protein
MTSRAARRKHAEEVARRERDLLVQHAEGGLRLTPGAQERIGRRLRAGHRSVVAAPESETQRRATIAGLRAASTRLQPDQLLALEALNTLADQGNLVAALIFESESKRLGVWEDKLISLPT